MEVENRSPVPVAVAFALRPYNPEGLASVGNVDLEETTVVVDGRPGVLLPRPPAGVAGSTFGAGDSVDRVRAGQAVPGPLDLEDPDGLAQAAFVYPVPHRGTIRVAMPLAHERWARRTGPLPRRGSVPAVDAGRLPGPAEVTRGWQAQLRRGLRLELPDSRLQAAVDSNRAYLLSFHGGDGIGRRHGVGATSRSGRPPPWWSRWTASVSTARPPRCCGPGRGGPHGADAGAAAPLGGARRRAVGHGPAPPADR